MTLKNACFLIENKSSNGGVSSIMLYSFREVFWGRGNKGPVGSFVGDMFNDRQIKYIVHEDMEGAFPFQQQDFPVACWFSGV